MDSLFEEDTLDSLMQASAVVPQKPKRSANDPIEAESKVPKISCPKRPATAVAKGKASSSKAKKAKAKPKAQAKKIGQVQRESIRHQ